MMAKRVRRRVIGHPGSPLMTVTALPPATYPRIQIGTWMEGAGIPSPSTLGSLLGSSKDLHPESKN